MKKTLKKSRKVNGNPKSPTKKGGGSDPHNPNNIINLRTSDTNNEEQNPALIPHNQEAQRINQNLQPYGLSLRILRLMTPDSRRIAFMRIAQQVNHRPHEFRTLQSYIAQVNEEEEDEQIRRQQRRGGSGLKRSKTRNGGKRGRKVKNKITKKRKNQKGGLITGKTVKWKGQHFNVYEVDKMANGDIRRDQVIDVSPDTDDKLRILITDFNKNASKKSIIKILNEKLTPNTNYLYVIEYYKSKKPKGKAGVIMYFDDDFHFGDHATVAGDTDTNPDRHVLAAGEIINWIPKTATLICNNKTGHYKIHHADAKKVINTFFNNSDKKTNITIDFRPFDDFDKECNCDKITQKRRQSGGTYKTELKILVDKYNKNIIPLMKEKTRIEEKMNEIDEDNKQIQSHEYMSTKDLAGKTNEEIMKLKNSFDILMKDITSLMAEFNRQLDKLEKKWKIKNGGAAPSDESIRHFNDFYGDNSELERAANRHRIYFHTIFNGVNYFNDNFPNSQGKTMLMDKIKDKIRSITNDVITAYIPNLINLTINSDNDKQDLLNFIRAN